MALPRAVLEQQAKAEQILEDSKKQTESGESQTDEVHDEPKQESKPDYEHQYRTLQGKYNTEIQRLNQQLLDSASTLNRQTAKNSQLQDAVDKLTRDLEQAKQHTPDPISEMEENGYDEGVVSAFKEMRDKIQALEAKNAELQNIGQRIDQQERTAAQTAEQRFWSDLTEQVADWQQINGDQRFHDWLGGEDALSGMTRQQLLDRAHNNLDAKRVAVLFNTFKNGRTKPKENISPSGGGDSGQPSGKKIYNRSDVAKFFQDVALGRTTLTKDQINQTERDILLAERENRIR